MTFVYIKDEVKNVTAAVTAAINKVCTGSLNENCLFIWRDWKFGEEGMCSGGAMRKCGYFCDPSKPVNPYVLM